MSLIKRTNLLSPHSLSRRQFVTGLAGGSALLAGCLPRALVGQETLHAQSGSGRLRLDIGYQKVNFTGKERTATTVNGSLPAPVLRFKEGERVTIDVHNNLASDSSIHWHGIILPENMDGVPGLSFSGIKPGEHYRYQFPILQSGTYWYHSHSGFQEQTGVYGALIIDPADGEPFPADKDYVVVLSDWTDDKPSSVYAKLKKQSDIYNWQERTLVDLWRDLREQGISDTAAERHMWNTMRMSDRDISDVNGTTYTFLMNGATPAEGWTGLFKPGEKVRLRIINASAMTLFDVRIPGLKMTVVASDGQAVEPVSVDEFRIGVAETYDVIVEPDDAAYCIFAQSIDRTGFARGTLTPDISVEATAPEMDPRPILTHADMGMAHHGGHAGHSSHDMHKMHQHHGIAPAGMPSNAPIVHPESEIGPQTDMAAESPQLRLDDPGVGLRNNDRRVLTYADLKNLYTTPDMRDPGREIQLHLTGNMERYMWSIDGIRFADAEPLKLKLGERVRITLVNDTMMNHPVHLHGMWSDLETGDPQHIPRKHTVIAQPGSKISYLVTADAPGRWAYHCHMMYHMMSMFRVVEVS